MCKGSTADSDSVCLGSNPSSAAIFILKGNEEIMNFVYYLSLGFIIILLAFKVNSLENENRGLKVTVFKLKKQLGLNISSEFLSPEIEKQILDLLSQGNKIGAIKVLKQEKNMSLKDAKAFIDSLK